LYVGGAYHTRSFKNYRGRGAYDDFKKRKLTGDPFKIESAPSVAPTIRLAPKPRPKTESFYTRLTAMQHGGSRFGAHKSYNDWEYPEMQYTQKGKK